MPIRVRDPISGAIVFMPTPEEKRLNNVEQELEDLKKLIQETNITENKTTNTNTKRSKSK